MAKAESELSGGMAMPRPAMGEGTAVRADSEPAFAKQLLRYRQRVRDVLSAFLPIADEPPSDLHGAMRYAALGNGKHIRPLLAYASGEALGIDPCRIDAMAGAVELVHAFSLVHDDLPAMDDDELRRGRPTTHVVYGEALAVLTGDALQVAAFHLLSADEALAREPRVQALAINMLARATGSLGMTGGQAMDIAAEGRQLSTNQLDDIYTRKTGRLIWASVAMPGAWTQDNDSFATRQLLNFAARIGLAFQIRDDLLEYLSTENITGKSTQSDEKNRKVTYPGLIGISRARQRAEKLYDEAMSYLDIFGRDAQLLKQLANFIVQRKR